MQMEMFMKEIGQMIRQRVMVFTHIKMELNIKDLGRMTNSME